MPTYVHLYKWTDQGIKDAKGVVERYERGRAAIEQAGGRIVGGWFTQGPYDAIGVIEWPDDESASVYALRAGASGRIRTETMRAYTTGEMQRLTDRLP